MDPTVVLQLPWPASAVAPNNARGAPWWKLRGRRSPTTVERMTAFAAARRVMSRRRGGWRSLPTPVTLEADFYPPDRRERDYDNLLGMLKASIDGIVQAGLLAGDSTDKLRIGRLDLREPAGAPARVYLILKPYNGGEA